MKYLLTCELILKECWTGVVTVGNPEPVIRVGLLDTEVGGETVLVRGCVYVLLHVGYLVALGAQDGVLCGLHGCGDDIGHFCGVRRGWCGRFFRTSVRWGSSYVICA